MAEAEAHADVALALRAELESRRDGDAAAPQEVLRQLERGQPQPPHVGEREVAALRRVAADPRDPVEPVDEVVALPLQVGDVVAEPRLHVAGEHGMGRPLPDRRAGLEGEAEDAVHVIDDLGGADRVADPVRGHAVRLREGEGRHGPLLHAGQRRDAVVRRPVQQGLLVLLVREHPEVEPPGQVGDLLELLAGCRRCPRGSRRCSSRGACSCGWPGAPGPRSRSATRPSRGRAAPGRPGRRPCGSPARCSRTPDRTAAPRHPRRPGSGTCCR